MQEPGVDPTVIRNLDWVVSWDAENGRQAYLRDAEIEWLYTFDDPPDNNLANWKKGLAGFG